MSEEFQRARTKEQKEIRMSVVMEVTDAQFQKMPYQSITLSTIARDLGSSRANLYRYVRTKEEIFLQLYLQKQTALIEDFKKKIKNVPCDPEIFGAQLAEVFSHHLDFLHYQSILAEIIEQNVSLEALTRFKKQVREDRTPIYAILTKQCPSLSPRQIQQLYLTFLYEGAGLYAHTMPGTLTQKAMKAAGYQGYQKDSFQNMMAEFITMCIEHYKPFHNEEKVHD
ncbi:MAG: TetR family transcriptional regulator [Lactimicrobium sp.]|jgi:AcrR family transcriptional regulator|uniref:TetR family transcriptional regulator n=1 Tax=Lactimicrobium sp. TaxID=2563780 RepID=UPI002F34FA22